VEVEEVWVGQFGRKVPLDQWEQEFGHVLSLPMSPSIAFDMGWYKDKSSIYLFGISGGRGEVQIGRCALKAYTDQRKDRIFFTTRHASEKITIGLPLEKNTTR
jgi:hypothetical protein